MKRLPNLDVLRFILIVYVILIHLSQLSLNQGLPNINFLFENHKGNEAIDVFFAMSGFLIIRIIYKAKVKNRFSIRKFYMRRILKIFPLYYLIVIFGFVFYHALLPILKIPFETNYNLVEGILYYTFFMANVFSRTYDVGGILGILWSIAIEEQFYIIIAPFLFFIKKKRIFISLFLLFLVSFVAFHIEAFAVLRQYKMEFFFIFFGGLIAILEEEKQLEFLKRFKVIPLAITILVVLYFFTSIFDFKTLWVYNLYITVLFGLFIHAISINNHNVAIRNKKMIYYGEISYGLYLYHIIVINLIVFIFSKLQANFQMHDWITIILMHVLSLGLTIFVSHISFKYFETYFLNLKEKFR
ncbi:MAG: acyltransferase [Bacteroidia bacterium]|nr:acyltransferase [Bacteroidia bacterium]MBT8278171.1 acyltransferase [Bacteroidia bacterium]NND26767.1 acyltransferase [Flavobacteriaceae bacterium]NNK61307.1 acyltransferase [Flavobacteriaceae bacterium]NNL32525.1 acyltransferase [Flavobacteriaceae bacterium]